MTESAAYIVFAASYIFIIGPGVVAFLAPTSNISYAQAVWISVLVPVMVAVVGTIVVAVTVAASVVFQ